VLEADGKGPDGERGHDAPFDACNPMGNKRRAR
jgi:hypothetical protein